MEKLPPERNDNGAVTDLDQDIESPFQKFKQLAKRLTNISREEYAAQEALHKRWQEGKNEPL